jgi:hypothetical protein
MGCVSSGGKQRRFSAEIFTLLVSITALLRRINQREITPAKLLKTTAREKKKKSRGKHSQPGEITILQEINYPGRN